VPRVHALKHFSRLLLYLRSVDGSLLAGRRRSWEPVFYSEGHYETKESPTRSVWVDLMTEDRRPLLRDSLKPKVVFSRTLDSVQGNARLAKASLAEEAADALHATDKDVGIGGAGLAAAAIELGLVDELRMFRNPHIVGGGTPFLPPVTEDVPLDLIETTTFGSRVIYERYRRVRADSG